MKTLKLFSLNCSFFDMKRFLTTLFVFGVIVSTPSISLANGTSYGNLTGYSYRHDWGYRNGKQKLTLNWCAITATSKVFVSISEADAYGNPFVGDARFTVHNVAPGNCKVTIRVNIEWGTPIHLVANYIVLP